MQIILSSCLITAFSMRYLYSHLSSQRCLEIILNFFFVKSLTKQIHHLRQCRLRRYVMAADNAYPVKV